jgi:hypothetical protein
MIYYYVSWVFSLSFSLYLSLSLSLVGTPATASKRGLKDSIVNLGGRRFAYWRY